jgi:hypothetical protein
MWQNFKRREKMTLQQAQENIGEKVIYRPYPNCDASQFEFGRIKSVNSQYVFVQYFHSTHTLGIATKPDNLTLDK